MKTDWRGRRLRLNTMETPQQRAIAREWLKYAEPTKESQRELADVIVASLTTENKYLITVAAPPQWGKTGAIHETMRQLAIGSYAPRGLFVLSGMSDTQWVAQTKARFIPAFRPNVFHRNKLDRAAQRIRDLSDVVIFIDECHIGSEANQTIHRIFHDAGLLDIDHIRQRNVRFVLISATPDAALIDAGRWPAALKQTIVAPESALSETNPFGYLGFKTILEEERVRTPRITSLETAEAILGQIRDRWPSEPMWSIFRVVASKRDYLIDAAKAAGFALYRHDSTQPLENAEELLATAPETHSILLIKDYWRAAKTLKDDYIGAVYDISTDYSTTAQGLAGRLCGYARRRGPTAPLLYVNRRALEDYVRLRENGFNYADPALMYRTVKIKVKGGVVLRSKPTVFHPSNMENLGPADIVIEAPAAPKTPKLRIVAREPVAAADDVPDDAVWLTRAPFDITDLLNQAAGITEILPASASDIDKKGFNKRVKEALWSSGVVCNHLQISYDEKRISRIGLGNYIRDKKNFNTGAWVWTVPETRRIHLIPLNRDEIAELREAGVYYAYTPEGQRMRFTVAVE